MTENVAVTIEKIENGSESLTAKELCVARKHYKQLFDLLSLMNGPYRIILSHIIDVQKVLDSYYEARKYMKQQRQREQREEEERLGTKPF